MTGMRSLGWDYKAGIGTSRGARLPSGKGLPTYAPSGRVWWRAGVVLIPRRFLFTMFDINVALYFRCVCSFSVLTSCDEP